MEYNVNGDMYGVSTEESPVEYCPNFKYTDYNRDEEGPTFSCYYDTKRAVNMDDKDLQGLIFRGINFKHIWTFRGSLMGNTKFEECHFGAKVCFDRADLTSATFRRCNGLSRCVFREATMDGIQFDDGVAGNITV